MKPQLRAALAQLRRLDRGSAASGATCCKVCGSPAFLFDIVDFNKVCAHDYYLFGFAHIPVLYHRCRSCGLIFTDFFDSWTSQDFIAHIYNSDYPLIDGDYAVVRPTRMADEMAALLADNHLARILDYGSGTGIFADRLRAGGFSAVEDYDPFASPRLPDGPFDVITCFETIEHSPSPTKTIAELRRFMKPEGCIIFTTSLQPASIDELRANWWYIAPRNGHAAIYTLAALELLGRSADLDLYAGGGLLAFAGGSPSPASASLLASIGPVQAQAQLTAPDGAPSPPGAQSAARPSDWHALEHSGSAHFRWTRSRRIEWMLLRPPRRFPCKLTLTIPLIMDVTAGFAERCIIEIGPRCYPLRRSDKGLCVTAELDQEIRTPIALITPPPERPSELSGAPDQRALGLAVPVAAAS